jgi:hypothetical protein
MLIDVFPYISEEPRLLYFHTGDTSSPSKPLSPSQVVSQPTIFKNGVSIPMNSGPGSCVGPFYHNNPAGHFLSFILYRLPSAASPSDVFTYSASNGWLVTSAGSANAVANAPITNYAGQWEAPLFDFVPFTYLPSAGQGLKVGMNASSAGIPQPTGSMSFPQNWLKRANQDNSDGPGTWKGIGSKTADGHPITISASNGVATALIAVNGASNEIDGTMYPDLIGTYVYQADETNPSSPMTAWAFLDANAGRIISGNVAPGPPQIPGTLVNGVLVGQTWIWQIAWAPSPSYYALSLQLAVQNGGKAPGNWTHANEYLYPPNGPGGPAQTGTRDPLAIDSNFVKQVTVGSTGAAVLRWMNNILEGDSSSNMVEVSDIRNPTDFLYNTAGRTANLYTITSVRPYALTTSPNVYFDNQFTNSIPNGSVTPPSSLAYYFAPSNLKYCQFGASVYAVECITSAPHNFSTGQFIVFSGTSFTMSITNGPSATTTDVFPIGYAAPCWVTGPSSFVMLYGSNNVNQYYPLGPNTLTATYTGITLTAKINYGGGNLPYETCGSATRQVPGCGTWFNIPIAATDAFIISAATRVRDNTTPGTKCIPELSNETWGFGQSINLDIALSWLTGIPSTNNGTGWYAYRCMQMHDLVESVFAATGRGSDVVRGCGSQAASSDVTQTIINTYNNWNSANPTNQKRLDVIWIAPYAAAPGVGYLGQNPAGPATVNVVGGGSTGGHLTAGTYYVAYTWIDALTGYESAVGSSESVQFTVAAGNIPQITVSKPALPLTASSYNIYLTLVNGAKGSEVLYGNLPSTGAATQTFNLSATNAGTILPPTNTLVPSFPWATASLAANDPRSIASNSVNPGNIYGADPWTDKEYFNYLRHAVKYDTQFIGTSGFMYQHQTVLNQYVPIIGQTQSVELWAYEGSYSTWVGFVIQNTLAGQVGSVPYNLSQDIFFHPLQYWCELAYLQMVQDSGIKVFTPFQLSSPLGNVGNPALWSYVMWIGDTGGYGDNSDGKGTNLYTSLIVNGVTPNGKANILTNVSPKLQAVKNWWLAQQSGTPTLQTIAVTPANPTVTAGMTEQFIATGTYSDSSTQNLTSQSTWASATTSVATIVSGGLATAVSIGSSTISAAMSGITGTTLMTVTTATLQSIAVTPANPSVTKGQTQQFTATGTYSDNSTQNLTNRATWASTATSIATVTSLGLATAVSVGSSTISAVFSGVTGTTLMTVTAPLLQSIAVTPTDPTIPIGQVQQFTATGTYSDGSTQNLTNQSLWGSANSAIATVNNSGLASGIADGSSVISASMTEITGTITGSTTLTVSFTGPARVPNTYPYVVDPNLISLISPDEEITTPVSPLAGGCRIFTWGLGVGQNVMVGTDLALWLPMSASGTFTRVDLVAKTPPVGSDLIIDILLSTNHGQTWTSLWSMNPQNRPRISAGLSYGAQDIFDMASFGQGSLLRIDVTQVGSTTPGTNVTVCLETQFSS